MGREPTEFNNGVQYYGPWITMPVSESYTSVVVNYVPSGVVALIQGGEYQSIPQSSSGYFIDASQSYDMDYPGQSVPMMYDWDCVEIYPNYGAKCIDFSLPESASDILTATYIDPNGVVIRTSTIYQIGDTSVEYKKYNISVKVTSQHTDTTSSTFSIITLLSKQVPKIDLQTATRLRVNKNQKLVLNASVISTKDYVWMSWANDKVDSKLPQLSSIPISKTMGAGTFSHNLIVLPDSLEMGVEYVFRLFASYQGEGILTDSISSISVSINSPPYNGQVSVSPNKGYALNTTFALQTYAVKRQILKNGRCRSCEVWSLL